MGILSTEQPNNQTSKTRPQTYMQGKNRKTPKQDKKTQPPPTSEIDRDGSIQPIVQTSVSLNSHLISKSSILKFKVTE
jgi:hypothetical protein